MSIISKYFYEFLSNVVELPFKFILQPTLKYLLCTTLVMYLYCVFQIESRNNLKKALTSLPAPRNDYEIVVPEDEPQPSDNEHPESATVLDQADLDLLKEQELKEASKFIFCMFFLV